MLGKTRIVFQVSLCLLWLLFVGGCGPSGPAKISLNNGTPNPSADGSSQIKAIVMDSRGRPVPGQSVVFTWKVSGSSQDEQMGVTNTTNKDGEAEYTLNGSGDQRAITVTAKVGDISQSVNVVFGPSLPAGFIAVSKSKMEWESADAFCQQQGGKLPLINGITRIDSLQIETAILDGFGKILDASWPAGLPTGDHYWTGTVCTLPSGRRDEGPCEVKRRDSQFYAYYDSVVYGAERRVVCLPR